MDYDQNVERQNKLLCREWLAKHKSIRESREIEKWLSLRCGKQATLTGAKHGAFNWCDKITFDDGLEWIIRFSVAGKVKHRDEKVAKEVSIMKLLQTSTKIPVPQIHFWGLSDANPVGLGPFIVMDFVKGMSFEEWWVDKNISENENELRIHLRELAFIYHQLSKITFPAACSPVLDGESDEMNYDPPLTMKMHEIEAHTTVKLGKSLFNLMALTN